MQRPCQGEVRVKYKRLERGTFVRFTPEQASFQTEVGDAMEALLQDTLMKHTALSQGDWVEVPCGENVYRLQVMDLEPGPAVSLIDTDLRYAHEPLSTSP